MKEKLITLGLFTMLFVFINGCIYNERIQPTTPSDTSAPAHLQTRVMENPGGVPTSTPVGTVVSGSDTYEYDDVFSSAKSITVNGASQLHNSYVSCDVDWIMFYCYSGVQYTVETNGLGTNSDTVIHLYNSSQSFLDSDDDGAVESLASKLVFTAGYTGYYYIKNDMYSCRSGSDTTYFIFVTSP